jgi:ribosomal protein L1
MQTFTIDCDGNITAFASQKEAQAADVAGAEYFGSQEELAKLAAAWPGPRLVEI